MGLVGRMGYEFFLCAVHETIICLPELERIVLKMSKTGKKNKKVSFSEYTKKKTHRERG